MRHLHTAISAMQLLATPIVLAPAVALVRYHILESALRQLSPGPAEPRVDCSPSLTREWLKSHYHFENCRKAVESPPWLFAENSGG